MNEIEVNRGLKHRLASQMNINMDTKKLFNFNFKKFTPIALGAGALAVLLLVVVVGQNPSIDPENPISTIAYDERVDDWKFDDVVVFEDARGGGGSVLFGMGGGGSVASSIGRGGGNFAVDEKLGFSVGGAKDVESFRQNIENKNLPLFDSLTYEGLFYEYFFDTGKQEECTELFCPSFTKAVSPDPISGEKEYYMSVGLNSGIKTEDFKRKPLNLVVVMDISGSMGSQFDEYYYDANGNYIEREVSSKTKMEVAKESLVDLIGHLNDEDRLGIVVFDDQAEIAKPLRYIGETDIDALEGHIMELSQRGGTNMSAGMERGMELLAQAPENSAYDNRVIFLTDAMPNIGQTSEEGLVGIAKKNAKDGRHSTFIGIGIDFHADLAKAITEIEGANHYSVNSAAEFAQRMDEGFEYMVTPLVFDLQLKLESDGYEIEQVYGSPESDKATGEIMYVNTLFPSLSVDGETRGGLVLLKLKKKSGGDDIQLKVSYRDRDDVSHGNESVVSFDESGEFYDNTGIRKGIVLSRYVDLVKSWIAYERESIAKNRYIDPFINEEIGIIAPWPMLGEWEQTSEPLTVSDEYQKLFKTFDSYLKSEIHAIGDKEMNQEVDILKVLINADRQEYGDGIVPFDDWIE